MGEGITDATVSLSSLETIDQVLAYGSIENRSYSVSINSQFSRIPLKTQFGYSLNETHLCLAFSLIKIVKTLRSRHFYLEFFSIK